MAAGKTDSAGEPKSSEPKTVSSPAVNSDAVKTPPGTDATDENTGADSRSEKPAVVALKEIKPLTPIPTRPTALPGPKTDPGQTETETQPEPRQKPQVEVHPAAGNYSKFQLGKNHTLFILAFDSITRQNYFLNAYRELMSREQITGANKLVDSYDEQFARLRDARATILESATDENPDTPTLLLNNRVETLELAISLRKRIVREVLTREQRRLHKENVERRKELRERLHPSGQDSAEQQNDPSIDPSKSRDDSGS